MILIPGHSNLSNHADCHHVISSRSVPSLPFLPISFDCKLYIFCSVQFVSLSLCIDILFFQSIFSFSLSCLRLLVFKVQSTNSCPSLLKLYFFPDSFLSRSSFCKIRIMLYFFFHCF